ncbi:MAG TPA: hypothetical protein VF465_20335 [Flavobacterium sp.]|uniref:hypothetical protein n=1 Tax=Flavobacterium sp. TaxID=239 RepID=UPI002ED52893
MKNQIILLSLLFVLISCSKKEEVKSFPFDDFVISSAGLHHLTSLKFTKSDTVYFQKRYPEPIENSYAILKSTESEKLNKLFNGINFTKFDSIYEQENLYDGQAYLLNVSIKEKHKRIFLYGNVISKELKTFIESLGQIKSNLKFLPTKKVVDFGDLGYLLPPPPPPKPERIHFVN